MNRQTTTVPEAAIRLGVSRSAAYRAVNAGEIPTLRVGRRVLVPTAWLDAALGTPESLSAGGAA